MPHFQKAHGPLTLSMWIEHGPSTFYISNLCPQPLAAMVTVDRPQEQAANVAGHLLPGHLDCPVPFLSVTSTSASLPDFCFFHLSFRIDLLAPMTLRWEMLLGSLVFQGTQVTWGCHRKTSHSAFSPPGCQEVSYKGMKPVIPGLLYLGLLIQGQCQE